MGAKLLAGGATALLVAFVIWLYGNAREESGRKSGTIAGDQLVMAANARAANAEIEAEKRVTAAVGSYATRAAALQPIVLRSTNTVREYAQTPAGAALCWSPDRLLGIDMLDRDLFTFTPTAGPGAAALPPYAGPPAAERLGVGR